MYNYSDKLSNFFTRSLAGDETASKRLTLVNAVQDSWTAWGEPQTLHLSTTNIGMTDKLSLTPLKKTTSRQNE